jgi:hypothetical protein
MDILFGTDCKDDAGRFHFVRCGAKGMELFVKYLRGIRWAKDSIPFTTAAIKLAQIVEEMEFLWYALHTLFAD